jgi:hypothetical protein
MSNINYNDMKCLKCKSFKLQRHFGINSRGETYKTCEVCRIKYRVNKSKYLYITNNSIDANNLQDNNNDNLNYKQELII